ncbi:MAG: SDR family oxidoreductase [Planctomycetota bacterium]|nr:SDR family oxidoreductase [Planctomycetota bacterium]
MTASAPAEKVAIVTGAGRGIGRSIAIALAANGVRVVLAARSEDQIAETAARIEADGGQAAAIVADVTNESSICDVVAQTIGRWGRLDILINNAGVGVFQPLEETATKTWDEIQDVNARGAFLFCREAIPHLRRQTTSYIINIASVVAVKGYINQAAYSASKHALLGMSKALAKEVQSDGIRVHAINPGGVATDLVKQARPDIDPADLIAPEQIANIVVFLVSQSGNAVIDEINVRRASSTPWA